MAGIPADGARPGIGPGDRRRRLEQLWSAVWDRLTVRAILVIGLPVLGVFMVLSAANVGGRVALWEPVHTTVAGLIAMAVAASAAHRSRGLERRLRNLVALGAASWAVGQVSWGRPGRVRASSASRRRRTSATSAS